MPIWIYVRMIPAVKYLPVARQVLGSQVVYQIKLLCTKAVIMA